LDNDKNTKLTRWIIILPILGVIVTALLLVESFIRHEKEIFTQNIFEVRKETIKANKLLAQSRVERMEDFIHSTKNTLEKKARNETRNITNFAIKIIETTYKENKDLPRKQILAKIKKRLRNVRFFDDLSGYFFMYDLNGTCLLLPPKPSLENKNLIDLKDAKGAFTVRQAIGIVKEKNQGFYDWYWYKPNESDQKKKIGYIKAFNPLGIYIGTARYEEDILKEIKSEIQNLLKNMRYGDSGYIFAYDYDGVNISHIAQEYVGINMSYVNVEGGYSVKNLVKGAKIIPDGYFMSYFKDLSSIKNKYKNKTTFVKDIPELGWIIGTGAYNKFIVDQINTKQLKLEQKLSETITQIVFLTLSILVVMLFITILVSGKLKNVLKNYQKNLIDKGMQNTAQQKQLIHQLEHDHLTSLPNRLLLSDRLEQIIKRSKREDKKAAILFLDLDKFKTINDTLGHDVGDILLIEVAKRLKNSIRSSDTAARLGGDEFIILIDNIKNMHDILEVIFKIQKNLKKDILINDVTHSTTASIGVSVYPNDGKTTAALIKNADIAMYKAKEDGRDSYRFFTSEINEAIQKEDKIEKDLRVAVQKNEFVLYYQPIVCAKTDAILGVESLIRWQHPKNGLIFPNDFIPIAEESKLIVDIGKWVIKESMTQICLWKEKGYSIKKVAINIAGKQLEDSNLLSYLQKMMKSTGCKPEWIELEVVERCFMKNIEKSIDTLNQIRALGIDIAMDDFGTGYSSLAYLRRLPITKLKIDRVFIKNILKSYEDRAIAEAIIALGSGLRMIILAEGVETKEEKEFLKYFGCDCMQGYFFSKPVPLADVDKLLEKGTCNT